MTPVRLPNTPDFPATVAQVPNTKAAVATTTTRTATRLGHRAGHPGTSTTAHREPTSTLLAKT